jgi:two-component system phosphate regulon response regulator PhoB
VLHACHPWTSHADRAFTRSPSSTRHRIEKEEGKFTPRLQSQLILVVEDERDLAEVVAYNLTRSGFRVTTVETARDAFTAIEAEKPALVLLDLLLPDMSGVDVCRRLKHDAVTRAIPVVMLTAKGEEQDRVRGFEVGADDYIVKPFSVRELLLRIQAVLRRATDLGGERVTFGRLVVDEAEHRVFVEDAEVELTALELRLLTTLLSRRGRVQSRDVLLDDVWGSADVTARTVDTHVKRLRSKLGSAGEYIETLRGVGYRFASEPDE